MRYLLLTPPVAFVIVLIGMLLLGGALSIFSLRRKRVTEDICKAYACGEDIRNPFIQPDYKQFFPFAFFFTILHIIALVITTVPKVSFDTFIMTLLYLCGAVIALLIFFRK